MLQLETSPASYLPTPSQLVLIIFFPRLLDGQKCVASKTQLEAQHLENQNVKDVGCVYLLKPPVTCDGLLKMLAAISA